MIRKHKRVYAHIKRWRREGMKKERRNVWWHSHNLSSMLYRREK